MDVIPPESDIAFNKMGPLAKDAYQHFNDVLDYIWKSPRLIAVEKRRESRKRKNYFPLDLPLNFHPAAVRASANVTPFGAMSVPA